MACTSTYGLVQVLNRRGGFPDAMDLIMIEIQQWETPSLYGT